jgi:hypothetical protein
VKLAADRDANATAKVTAAVQQARDGTHQTRKAISDMQHVIDRVAAANRAATVNVGVMAQKAGERTALAVHNAKAAVDRVDDAMERNIIVLRNKKLGVRLYNTVSIRAQTIINGRVYQANVDRQNYYVKPGTAAVPE